MLDFIMAPLIVGIVTLGIYKLFELFVRRKERISIIEKMSDKFDPSMIESSFSFSINDGKTSAFSTLKLACLLLGIGMGLLVGFFVILNTIGISSNPDINWQLRETTGVIYGASVLLFGGLGLLVAFLIEMKNNKKIEK